MASLLLRACFPCKRQAAHALSMLCPASPARDRPCKSAHLPSASCATSRHQTSLNFMVTFRAAKAWSCVKGVIIKHACSDTYQRPVCTGQELIPNGVDEAPTHLARVLLYLHTLPVHKHALLLHQRPCLPAPPRAWLACQENLPTVLIDAGAKSCHSLKPDLLQMRAFPCSAEIHVSCVMQAPSIALMLSTTADLHTSKLKPCM